MLERVLAPLARRWAWVGTVGRVQQRFSDVHGGSLASSVTLAAFLSLFPLLLALIGILGFFSARAADLPAEVIGRLGLTGEAADAVVSAMEVAEGSRRTATVLGVLGLLWSGLGLVGALQQAFNSVWQVPGRGLKGKLYGLLWLGGAVVIMVASFGAAALLRLLPGPAAPAVLVGALAVDVALWLWTLHTLCHRDVGWKALLPGAVLGAVGLELLKVVGAIYVPMAVAGSSALYGSIGVVFALLAWLLFFGRLVVYAAVLNVVRWEEDHGTVTAEIELPRVPGAVPINATRSGEAVQPT
ncbi:MAG: YihY/virulence factor BrkB family protein [Actinobacteria bacterium]|nr:YihY/virulence factor BrkB family protein [Actinomycetota bacterium]